MMIFFLLKIKINTNKNGAAVRLIIAAANYDVSLALKKIKSQLFFF